MICKNCGAKIPDEKAACEYCGFMNYERAEQEYFEELDDIRDDLSELEYAPEEAEHHAVSGIITSTITVLVIGLAVILLYSVFSKMGGF